MKAAIRARTYARTVTVIATRIQALTVETTPLDDVRHIIPFTDAHAPLVWLRKGEGIAGVGEALRLEFRGADRIAQASAAWKQLGSLLAESGDVTAAIGTYRSGIAAAQKRGDKQAEKEMNVFLRRLEKSGA